MTDASVSPDFIQLVRFLVEPFLEDPKTLKTDCEISASRSKVLIRLAFEGSDRGRVFGRGGRNIQAIRTLVKATAQMSGWTAHLDVYGEPTADSPTRKGPPRGGPRGGRGRPRPARDS